MARPASPPCLFCSWCHKPPCLKNEMPYENVCNLALSTCKQNTYFVVVVVVNNFQYRLGLGYEQQESVLGDVAVTVNELKWGWGVCCDYWLWQTPYPLSSTSAFGSAQVTDWPLAASSSCCVPGLRPGLRPGHRVAWGFVLKKIYFFGGGGVIPCRLQSAKVSHLCMELQNRNQITTKEKIWKIRF